MGTLSIKNVAWVRQENNKDIYCYSDGNKDLKFISFPVEDAISTEGVISYLNFPQKETKQKEK